MSPGRSKPRSGVPGFDGGCPLCGKDAFVDALQFRNHVTAHSHRDSGWLDALREAQGALQTTEDSHFVYVIELEDGAGAMDNPDRPWVYVGMTGLTPAERFEKHKQGGRTAAGVVERHGVRLRPDLAPNKGKPLPKAEAETLEYRWARQLEEDGYNVKGASKPGYELQHVSAEEPTSEDGRSACCEQPDRHETELNFRPVSVCQNCGTARARIGDAEIPNPAAFETYLSAKYAQDKDQESKQPWFDVTIARHESESRLRDRVHLNPTGTRQPTIELGDSITLETDGDAYSGWITEEAGRELIAYVEPLSDSPGPGQDGRIRKSDLSSLSGRHLGFFRRVREHFLRFTSLFSPQALPPLDEQLVPEAALHEPPVDFLNDRQRDALRLGLSVPHNGIGLIQGPPGTGKTTVVAQLVRLLAQHGYSVLVTAHTHVAIDNALEQIIDLDEDLRTELVRFGPSTKIGPRLEPYYKTFDDFPYVEEQDRFNAITKHFPIVGMTLDTTLTRIGREDGFDFDRFDVVIVDEASMILYHKAAMALAAGDRLVLVGDQFQLPPIVPVKKYANRPEFSRSTFEALASRRPDLLTRLEIQYRSVPGVMDWSNETLYDKALVTDREATDTSLELNGRRIEGPVTWIETGHLSDNEHLARRPEGRRQASYGNPMHAALAVELVEELLTEGYDAEEIGFIAPFRLQAHAFKTLAVRHLPRGLGHQIESSTVDAFQGREKEIILYDITTLTPKKSHDSFNRLNVSLTRAKDHLFIIGDRKFAVSPRDNPLYWSLQQWADSQILGADTPDPALLDQADLSVRTGRKVTKSKISTLRELMDHPDFREPQYEMLENAFRNRHDESVCSPMLYRLVQQVNPGTNVKALYEELKELDELPPDRNQAIKAAMREARSVLENPDDNIPLHLQLPPKKQKLERAVENANSLSEGLKTRVDRLLKELKSKSRPG